MIGISDPTTITLKVASHLNLHVFLSALAWDLLTVHPGDIQHAQLCFWYCSWGSLPFLLLVPTYFLETRSWQDWTLIWHILYEKVLQTNSESFKLIKRRNSTVFLVNAEGQPCVNGEVIRWRTEELPADWPPIVTRSRLPPKCPMFSCIHFKASTWSLRPIFPLTTPSPVFRNPIFQFKHIVISIN